MHRTPPVNQDPPTNRQPATDDIAAFAAHTPVSSNPADVAAYLQVLHWVEAYVSAQPQGPRARRRAARFASRAFSAYWSAVAVRNRASQ